MIIRNGTVQIIEPTSPSYERDGTPRSRYPQKKEMPAQIVPLEQDYHRKTSATGRPIDYAKYIVFVEARDYESFISHWNRPSEACIMPDRGIEVKVQVLSVEYLRAVSQYKLTVVQRTHG